MNLSRPLFPRENSLTDPGNRHTSQFRTEKSKSTPKLSALSGFDRKTAAQPTHLLFQVSVDRSLLPLQRAPTVDSRDSFSSMYMCSSSFPPLSHILLRTQVPDLTGGSLVGRSLVFQPKNLFSSSLSARKRHPDSGDRTGPPSLTGFASRSSVYLGFPLSSSTYDRGLSRTETGRARRRRKNLETSRERRALCCFDSEASQRG